MEEVEAKSEESGRRGSEGCQWLRQVCNKQAVQNRDRSGGKKRQHESKIVENVFVRLYSEISCNLHRKGWQHRYVQADFDGVYAGGAAPVPAHRQVILTCRINQTLLAKVMPHNDAARRPYDQSSGDVVLAAVGTRVRDLEYLS
jgi:hypothetical protein